MDDQFEICKECGHFFDPGNGDIPARYAHIVFVSRGKETCQKCRESIEQWPRG